MNKYIVINETEIVKAEIERPVMHKHIEVWEQHCLSLPCIPIKGKHNWKVWQEVEEGKDFEFRQIPDGGRSVKSAEGIPYDYEQWFKVVAIPIEQTKSEQVDDVKEYILCAAIWYKDDNNHQHQPKNIQSGFVVCGRRHHNCLMVASICLADNYSSVKGTAKQGFITNLDRFVDRMEAGIIAFNANQINEPTDCLFSEDLY